MARRWPRSVKLWNRQGQNPQTDNHWRRCALKIPYFTARRHSQKGNDMLVKTKHEIEVQNIEGFAIYAEYLTYWHAV